MCLCKPKSMDEVILLIQDSEIQYSNKKVLRAPESCNQKAKQLQKNQYFLYFHGAGAKFKTLSTFLLSYEGYGLSGYY